MELVFLVLILMLGGAVLLESNRGDQLQRENDNLREENQSLRIQTMTERREGVGCGSILGFLAGLAVLVFIIYAVGVLPG